MSLLQDELKANLSPEELQRVHALLAEDAQEQSNSDPINFMKTEKLRNSGGGNNNSNSVFTFDIEEEEDKNERNPDDNDSGGGVLSPRSIWFKDESLSKTLPAGSTSLYDQVQQRLRTHKRSGSVTSLDGRTSTNSVEKARKSAKLWRQKTRAKRGSQTPRGTTKRRQSRTHDRVARSRNKSATTGGEASFKDLFAHFKDTGEVPGLTGKHEETFSPSMYASQDSNNSNNIISKTSNISREEIESLKKQLKTLETKLKDANRQTEKERQKRRQVEKSKLMLKSDMNESRRQLKRADTSKDKMESELKRLKTELDATQYELQMAKNLQESDPNNRRLQIELKQREMVINELCQRVNVMETEAKKTQEAIMRRKMKDFDTLVAQSEPALLQKRLMELEKQLEIQNRGCCSGRSKQQDDEEAAAVTNDDESEESNSDEDEPLLSKKNKSCWSCTCR